MADVSAAGDKLSSSQHTIKVEESELRVMQSEKGDTSTKTGVISSMKGATRSNTLNTTETNISKGGKVLNLTYPQREWNTCTGAFCPFGWIHIARDANKIEEIEALGDITNAIDAKTWSKLKFNPRRYSLEALLKVGELISKNALGYLDPKKFKSGAIEENLLKLTKWYRIRGVSSVSQDSEDGTGLVGADVAIPIRQPNQPPIGHEAHVDAGFGKMPVRQPKPPPKSLKDQYEQGFVQRPTRQPFGPPNPNELTGYGTLGRHWPGFNPYNPIRQPRQPPKDLRDQVDTGFAMHPIRQPIAAPAIDPISGKVDIGFKDRFQVAGQYTDSYDDVLMVDATPVTTPIRQPVPAPMRGKIHVVQANFKHFLEKHQSPTHQRVTAGGRIVPFNPDARPPQFDLQKLSKEGTITELKCTSNGSVHVIGGPRHPITTTPQNASVQNAGFKGQAPNAGTRNLQQAGSQSKSNDGQHAFQNQGHDAAQGGSQTTFRNQWQDAAQFGSQAMPGAGQQVFQSQGMGCAPQLGSPFPNQGIATAHLENPAHNVLGVAQPMSLPAALPFHNQGIGSMPNLGQALPLYSQPMYNLDPTYAYSKTAQELAAYQQAVMNVALPQAPMVAYNMQAAGNGVVIRGNQPYAPNAAMAFNHCPLGAVIKNDLNHVTQDITTLEQYLKTLELGIQKTESELKLLDSHRSYFDDHLGNGEKDNFIAKRRAIVTRRAELRQDYRYLQDVANGEISQTPSEGLNHTNSYAGVAGLGYPQNLNMFVPQALAQQSASAPMNFESVPNLGVAHQNQYLGQSINHFSGVPASYLANRLASGSSGKEIPPRKGSETTRQYAGSFGGQIPVSHQLNVQAPEWTPNGSNATGYGNVDGGTQKDSRNHRSASEEIKKELDHVSHAEASGSSGHLGDNLDSVAAVSDEVIRQVFNALQSAGPTDRLITIRIGGGREITFQSQSGAVSGAQVHSSPRDHGNSNTSGLNRVRTSSGAATYDSSPSRNIDTQVDDLVRAQTSRAPHVAGISPFQRGSNNGLPTRLPTSASGPSTPPRRQDPYRHKVSSSVASTNVNAQGYLGQIDGAADYLGPMSSKSKNASVVKAADKLADVQQKEPTTKANENQPYGKLSRALAESRDVKNFFKLIRDEEDPVIEQYKTENPM